MIDLCKHCAKNRKTEREKAWYRDNADHAKAYLKAYGEAHSEKILGSAKAYRKAIRQDRDCLAFFQHIEAAAQITRAITSHP
jgi:hypothetical protein